MQGRETVTSSASADVTISIAEQLQILASPIKQVLIETAQSGLDCAVLEKLSGKTIILGTFDLSDMDIETQETVAAGRGSSA